MYAIIKHAFLFRLPGTPTDLSGVDATPGPIRNLRVDASPNPQQLPDWVGETRLFQEGCKRGRILELKGIPNVKALEVGTLPEAGVPLGLEQEPDPENGKPLTKAQKKAAEKAAKAADKDSD